MQKTKANAMRLLASLEAMLGQPEDHEGSVLHQLTAMLDAIADGFFGSDRSYEFTSAQRARLESLVVAIASSPRYRITDAFMQEARRVLFSRPLLLAVLANQNVPLHIALSCLAQAKESGFAEKALQVFRQNAVLPLLLLEDPNLLASPHLIQKKASKKAYHLRKLTEQLHHYGEVRGTHIYYPESDEDGDSEDNRDFSMPQTEEIPHPGLLALFALLDDIMPDGQIVVDRSTGDEPWRWRYRIEDRGWRELHWIWNRITHYNDYVHPDALQALFYGIDEVDDKTGTDQAREKFLLQVAASFGTYEDESD